MPLKESLEQEGISLDSGIDKLVRFAHLLEEWNKVHNLTGAKNLNAINDNIVDALFPLTFIKKPHSLLDVGTGAGFPGLALATALQGTEVTLCEPLNKRVAFLRYAIMDLGLENVRVEAKRVETLKHTPFELISSRAVTNTKLLLKLTENLSDDKTAYLFYKGERVFDEIKEVQHQLDYDIVQKNHRNYLYIKSRVC
jgi:16S rRNA (guanine527-N7)-methyltransferase